MTRDPNKAVEMSAGERRQIMMRYTDLNILVEISAADRRRKEALVADGRDRLETHQCKITLHVMDYDDAVEELIARLRTELAISPRLLSAFWTEITGAKAWLYDEKDELVWREVTFIEDGSILD